jgi:hypothetical protein
MLTTFKRLIVGLAAGLFLPVVLTTTANAAVSHTAPGGSGRARGTAGQIQERTRGWRSKCRRTRLAYPSCQAVRGILARVPARLSLTPPDWPTCREAAADASCPMALGTSANLSPISK